jgi:hypothetical protein
MENENSRKRLPLLENVSVYEAENKYKAGDEITIDHKDHGKVKVTVSNVKGNTIFYKCDEPKFMGSIGVDKVINEKPAKKVVKEPAKPKEKETPKEPVKPKEKETPKPKEKESAKPYEKPGKMDPKRDDRFPYEPKEKDHMRIASLISRAGGDKTKEDTFSRSEAYMIQDYAKAMRRANAASDAGKQNIAKIFAARADEIGE